VHALALALRRAKCGTGAVPVIWLSHKMATTLFQGEKYSVSALMAFGSGVEPASVSAPNGPPVTVTLPFELNAGKNATLTIAAKNEKPMTQNVVAVWEGSDPVLKSEYVAVGAHYDHIGICAPGTADPICNGADDDGSGTTALLGMAEAISHAKERPKRSVLFVWHCGEEKGLWGSRYFTDYPTIPLDRIVTQLNIDMIGRSKKAGDTNPLNANLSGPNQIYVIGSTMMSTELGQLSERVNKSYLNLQYDLRYDDPADPNRFWTIQMYPFDAGNPDVWSTQITELLTAPLLSISSSGTNVMISWTSLATGYQLQSAASLASPVIWSNVPQPTLTNAGQAFVLAPVSGGGQFFRLSHP